MEGELGVGGDIQAESGLGSCSGGAGMGSGYGAGLGSGYGAGLGSGYGAGLGSGSGSGAEAESRSGAGSGIDNIERNCTYTGLQY